MKKFLIFAVAVLGLAACKEPQVEPQGEKLKLNKSEVSIAVSDTIQLSANVSVTWTSSDYSVASVSNTGLVQGIKEGVATITASSVDNQKATCKVTVTSDSGGGDDPVEEKPAYCVELITSYSDVEGIDLHTGVVMRIVYERGDDPKYLLSTTQYGVDGMTVKTEYTNSGLYQYGVCTYCNNGSTSVGAKDTTIYLDDARLYIKESRSSGSKFLYEYDASNRQISSVIYVAGEKNQEWHYKYEAGYRYGNGIYYGENGYLMRDTIEFNGLSFDYRTAKRHVTISENLEKGTYSLNEYVYQFEGGRRKSCTYRTYSNNKGVESEYIYYSTFTWYNDWDYTQTTVYDFTGYSYTTETTYRYRQ